MQIAITVKFWSNSAGAGMLRASFKGRCASVGYPHHLPSALKNWEAARALAAKLERDYGYALQLVRRSSRDSCVPSQVSETFHFLAHGDGARGSFDNEHAARTDELPARSARCGHCGEANRFEGTHGRGYCVPTHTAASCAHC